MELDAAKHYSCNVCNRIVSFQLTSEQPSEQPHHFEASTYWVGHRILGWHKVLHIDKYCALQLQFNHNSQQGILDLLNGDADVALARADITSDMTASGLIASMDLFKCVTAVSSSSPHSPCLLVPATPSYLLASTASRQQRQSMHNQAMQLSIMTLDLLAWHAHSLVVRLQFAKCGWGPWQCRHMLVHIVRVLQLVHGQQGIAHQTRHLEGQAFKTGVMAV